MTITALDAIACTKQTSALGLTFGTPKTFEATSAGAAGGTTIISSTLGSYQSADDDLVGMAVMVVYAANGPTGERGSPLIRRIKAYAHSTTTLTIDSLPFQVSASDSFLLLDLPIGFFSEETGGSQVNFIDTTRDEVDDFWVGSAQQGGPYLQVLNADSISTSINSLITNFVSSTGTLSTANMSASTAIGDLAEAWSYHEFVDSAPFALNHARLERVPVTGTQGKKRGVAGVLECSATKNMLFRGPGRTRIGEPAELDLHLGSVMDAAAVTDCTADAGSTTSDIVIASGSPSVGEMFVTEAGDAFVVSAIPSNVTPSPTLRTAPATGTNLYGMRKYTPSEDINYAIAWQEWFGKTSCQYVFGSVPAITVAGARGDYLKFSMNYVGTHGFRFHKGPTNAALSRPWRPKLPTVTPRQVRDVRCVLGSTTLELRAFDLDFGLDLQQHPNLEAPNTVDGYTLIMDAVGGNLELFDGADYHDEVQNFIQGKPLTLLIQVNTVPGEPGVWAFWSYEIEYTGNEDADDAGQRTGKLPFSVTEDDTFTTVDRWVMGIA